MISYVLIVFNSMSLVSWFPGYIWRVINLLKGTQFLETKVHMTNLTKNSTYSYESNHIFGLIRFECKYLGILLSNRIGIFNS